jgi:hypothetical protein
VGERGFGGRTANGTELMEAPPYIFVLCSVPLKVKKPEAKTNGLLLREKIIVLLALPFVVVIV